MSFDWFLTLFERFYNFFAILVGNLEKPFNEIFYSFTIYNPFGNYEYVFRFETANETINNFINEFNEVVLSIVSALISGSGVDVTQPTWVVFLTLLPGIFVAVIIIRLLIGLFK